MPSSGKEAAAAKGKRAREQGLKSTSSKPTPAKKAAAKAQSNAQSQETSAAKLPESLIPSFKAFLGNKEKDTEQETPENAQANPMAKTKTSKNGKKEKPSKKRKLSDGDTSPSKGKKRKMQSAEELKLKKKKKKSKASDSIKSTKKKDSKEKKSDKSKNSIPIPCGHIKSWVLINVPGPIFFSHCLMHSAAPMW